MSVKKPKKSPQHEVGQNMAGRFAPIAVDLHRVRDVVGSKSRSLLPALQKRYPTCFAGVNSQLAGEDEGSPSLENVLKELIAGRPIHPGWSFQFEVATELLCRHFGSILSNQSFSSMRIEWAEEVDEAIRFVGIPKNRFSLVQLLFNRGSPLGFAGVTEMCMGYATLAEVRGAIRAFAKADYTPLRPNVRLAVAEVRSWLVSCDTLGCDLVGVYSG